MDSLHNLYNVNSRPHIDERIPPLGRDSTVPQLSDGMIKRIWNRIQRDDVLGEQALVE
jgi:hypothetical protein